MNNPKEDSRLCGIVMPISDCDGRPASHWADVLKIIQDAANSVGLSARLVSDTMDSNLIHKEILSNIYNDDIVVVDVSGRNPNVFFELGVRMATQKPTVIVKDDTTSYPFDTGPNRFVEYPRDLRHPQMETFKSRLADALIATISHTAEKSFIGQLGPFQIPKIEAKEISFNDAILSKLDVLERRMSMLSTVGNERASDDSMLHVTKDVSIKRLIDGGLELVCRNMSKSQITNGIQDFQREGGPAEIPFRLIDASPKLTIVRVEGSNGRSLEFMRTLALKIEVALPF
jgi:hypothetical protein